jgi:methyl-accepting chemotaxis protein
LSPSILDGLSLIDLTGRTILATTLASLGLGVLVNLFARSRYRRLEEDLDENRASQRRFRNEVLNDIVRSAEEAAGRSPEPNTQGIIEERFQSDLKPLLLAERFGRAATGLVIILGLLGTFYGLTSSIGKLVQLVAGDPGGVAGVTESVTNGLTQSLSGMAIAFSNSLVGVGSAVILTVLGVFSNPTDRRVALMIRIETYLDRRLSGPALAPGSRDQALERCALSFEHSVERLEGVVARFDSALQAFSTSTRDFSEFNAHLKDNVQRMSLSFGDLNDSLKTQIVALKRENGR